VLCIDVLLPLVADDAAFFLLEDDDGAESGVAIVVSADDDVVRFSNRFALSSFRRSDITHAFVSRSRAAERTLHEWLSFWDVFCLLREPYYERLLRDRSRMRLRLASWPTQSGSRLLTTLLQAKSQGQLNESMLSGTNTIYIEQMHENWLKNRQSVHASWDAFFTNVDNGVPPGAAFSVPPTL
jgi:hypothetical protein